MNTDNIIREHLEEQFSNTSRFLWYEDKQMLNEGRYIEFAKAQLRKTKQSFWLLSPFVLILSWYAVTNLIEYGAEPNWFSLVYGLSCLCVIFWVLVKSCREYYSVKSSMSLIIKLFEDPSTANNSTEGATLKN